MNSHALWHIHGFCFLSTIDVDSGFQQELNNAEVLLDMTMTARMSYVWRAGATVLPTVCMYYFLQNGNEREI